MTTETFFIGGAPKSFFQPQTAGQDAFAMVYSSKTACWSRSMDCLDKLGLCATPWQKARAKKPQHSTCFDETIQ